MSCGVHEGSSPGPPGPLGAEAPCSLSHLLFLGERHTKRRSEVPGTLDFHWHWLNSKPVLWTVLAVIVIVGGVYYGLVQRTKPAHMQAPEGELPEAAPPAPAPAS